jgi:hypothetical protein
MCPIDDVLDNFYPSINALHTAAEQAPSALLEKLSPEKASMSVRALGGEVSFAMRSWGGLISVYHNLYPTGKEAGAEQALQAIKSALLTEKNGLSDRNIKYIANGHC